jgi:hypothetical protein
MDVAAAFQCFQFVSDRFDATTTAHVFNLEFHTYLLCCLGQHNHGVRAVQAALTPINPSTIAQIGDVLNYFAAQSYKNTHCRQYALLFGAFVIL